MSNIDECMKLTMEIPGAIGVALVDYESGMMLGSAGGGDALDLEVAAAGNTSVVRAKTQTMAQLNLNDEIEDILITLGKHYHLIRLVSGEKGRGLFFYLALNRTQANLALARRQLQDIEKQLVL